MYKYEILKVEDLKSETEGSLHVRVKVPTDDDIVVIQIRHSI